MAIFNLTDISFGKSSLFGGSKTLVGGKYESNLHRYPVDIGDTNRGHYMVIHINVQDQTNYSSYEYTGDDPTAIANAKAYQKLNLNTSVGTIGSGLSSIGSSIGSNETVSSLSSTLGSGLSNLAGVFSSAAPGVSSFIGGFFGEMGGVAEDAYKAYSSPAAIRTVRRVTDTIALYMPDTLTFQNVQHYTDLTTGKNEIAAAISAAAGFAKNVQSGSSASSMGAGIAKNLSPYLLSRLANRLGGDIGTSAFSTVTGLVENPMLELLYTSPDFRSFSFTFMFYPTSQQEAQSVLKIINRLQFHQAPELKREFNGYYLIPPSEFDIKFYCNGQINTNIPPISTCVLQSVDVDYAPHGFTAYEVPGQTTPSEGGTGMPVAIQLTLQFREAEIMTKDNFNTEHFMKDMEQEGTVIDDNVPSNITGSGYNFGQEMPTSIGDSYKKFLSNK